MLILQHDYCKYNAAKLINANRTVTAMHDRDILDVRFLSTGVYELQVPEDHKLNEKIGSLELEDRDQIQNKDPIFTIALPFNSVFDVERSPSRDGNLMLKQVGGSC